MLVGIRAIPQARLAGGPDGGGRKGRAIPQARLAGSPDGGGRKRLDAKRYEAGSVGWPLSADALLIAFLAAWRIGAPGARVRSSRSARSVLWIRIASAWISRNVRA